MRITRWVLLVVLIICLVSLVPGQDEALSVPSAISVGPQPPLREVWRERPPEEHDVRWPVAVENLIVASAGSGVMAVEGVSGRRVWFSRIEGGQSSSSVTFGKGRIFAVGSTGTLFSLNSSDGQVLWRRPLPGRTEEAPFVADEVLLATVPEAKTTLALRADSGDVLWSEETDFEPSSVLAQESVAIVTTQDLNSERGLLVALDLATGKELWRKQLEEGNNAPSASGGVVYLANGNFTAMSLDLKTGKEIWTAPIPGKFGPRNMPALALGDMFLADRTGQVYRLDGKTGREVWRFTEGEGTFLNSSPIVVGKTLYIGSGAGWLYALDVDDGRLLWKHQVGGFIYFGAADSERIYFGVKNRNEGLYAFEHDPDGELIASDPATDPITGLIGGLFLLVIGGGGVILYARRRSRRGQTEPV